MLSTDEFKRGVRIEVDGEPYAIVDLTTQSPSARSSNTLIKARLRHLRTGQLREQTFKAGERLKQPDFAWCTVKYLYAESDDSHVFMDLENYEQYTLSRESIADALNYLQFNDEAKGMLLNQECIGVEVPATMVMRVAYAEPGERGNTVTAATKSARLETGLVLQVPLFVHEGDNIVVDTRDGRYIRRAS